MERKPFGRENERIDGRAAASFVVLAGLGLGLSARAPFSKAISTTLRRAIFLLIIGLANMTIFDADILHYYAFYFAFGALFLTSSTRILITAIIALNISFVFMILHFDYDVGWNWNTYIYADFWTPNGFIRNLFFNGWHPVIPWLSFLLFGMILSRLPLGTSRVKWWLTIGGTFAVATSSGASKLLMPYLTRTDPELFFLAETGPVPPVPLYMLAGMGAASLLIGICLTLEPHAKRLKVLAYLTPAGRQTLTLYMAHIIVGMGTLEAFDLLGNRSLSEALLTAVAFCLISAVFSYLWAQRFKRGPLESVMRRVAG